MLSQVPPPEALQVALQRARADLAQRSGDVDEAITHLHEALAGIEGLRGATSLQAARTHGRIGELEQVRGRIDQAVSRNLRAMALAQEIFGPDHPGTAPFLRRLGEAMVAGGQTVQGQAYRDRADRILGGAESGGPD